jgi:hypothetical protein
MNNINTKMTYSEVVKKNEQQYKDNLKIPKNIHLSLTTKYPSQWKEFRQQADQLGLEIELDDNRGYYVDNGVATVSFEEYIRFSITIFINTTGNICYVDNSDNK